MFIFSKSKNATRVAILFAVGTLFVSAVHVHSTRPSADVRVHAQARFRYVRQENTAGHDAFVLGFKNIDDSPCELHTRHSELKMVLADAQVKNQGKPWSNALSQLRGVMEWNFPYGAATRHAALKKFADSDMSDEHWVDFCEQLGAALGLSRVKEVNPKPFSFESDRNQDFFPTPADARASGVRANTTASASRTPRKSVSFDPHTICDEKHTRVKKYATEHFVSKIIRSG